MAATALYNSSPIFERAFQPLMGNHSLNLFYGTFLSKTMKYRSFGKQFNAHEVYPDVYVGDVYAAHHVEELKKRGITHIVTCVVGVVPAYPEQFTYLHIPLLDSTQQNISEHFEKTTTFIGNALADGGKVLVHCIQGVSRSATITAAYVMAHLDCCPDEAVKILQQSRTVIKPNSGFMQQLEWYDKKRRVLSHRRASCAV